MKKTTISRRKFIRNSSAAAVAGSLYFGLPGKSSAGTNSRSKVVLIRDKAVLDDLYKPDFKILSSMMDEGMKKLFDTGSAKEAWSGIISPDDKVGIKTNVWRYLRTPPELEQIIANGLMDAGVKKNNIAIKDRGIHNDEFFLNATALINSRPMRTHHWAGVGSLLKNYITFISKPYTLHDDSCADLATLWSLPDVKGKTRLNILVMLTPLFHGVGPHHFNPEYTWKYNGLLLGTDPVAVDATGLRIIQAKRKQYFGEDMPLNPPAKHIVLADTRHKLGNADPENIDLIRIGWEDDLLI